MHRSLATSRIIDSSVFMKDPSINDATTTAVTRLDVCFCSAHRHEDSPYKHPRTSGQYRLRVMSLFTVIMGWLENAMIKTVICVNLNNGQFQCITNRCTRKGCLDTTNEHYVISDKAIAGHFSSISSSLADTNSESGTVRLV